MLCICYVWQGATEAANEICARSGTVAVGIDGGDCGRERTSDVRWRNSFRSERGRLGKVGFCFGNVFDFCRDRWKQTGDPVRENGVLRILERGGTSFGCVTGNRG